MGKLFFIFLVGISLSFSQNLEEEKVIEIGMGTSSLLHSTLKGKMKKEVNKEDKIQVVNFCIEQAQSITKGVNNLLPDGVSVKRISAKNRNEKNTPTPEDHKILQELEQNVKDNKKKYKLVKTDSGYKMYRAILIQKHCLHCHGPKATMNSTIKSKIEKIYPDDKAFGFSLGDFRGAYLIDIDKKAYK